MMAGWAGCCGPGRSARRCPPMWERMPSSPGSTSAGSWRWSSPRRAPWPSGSGREAPASPHSTRPPATAR
uniref:Alternative protein n=1 Tax=Macrostomum lignano TaxID=282301 RepID=A0A1I8J3F8_9PLAT